MCIRDRNPLAGKMRTFDWHQNYDKLVEYFVQYKITPGKLVTILGCGNSKLGEDMNDNGFSSITCVDWSSVVIERMMDRCSARSGLIWLNMDVTDKAEMSAAIPDDSQDVVVDKALFDCMMSSEKSTDQIVAMLQEVQRILHQGGVYFLVTHGSKDSRMWYLKHAKLKPWNVQEDQSEEDNVPKIEMDPLSLDSRARAEGSHKVFVCTFS
eukprot:TRINITY_DN22422_c0_g1_i2.p1 TRINITY_DN22422_c0_g1~~TRINITY_DN22422_c0_g1_i2.p1  ORF type:complete len:210 (+),score=57.07 TRINITY_DN22422_c0_g1_i2:175-804(+)